MQIRKNSRYIAWHFVAVVPLCDSMLTYYKGRNTLYNRFLSKIFFLFSFVTTPH
jgi:hypothetical protein